VPMWGFVSSPLVVDGVVIVYAGGPEGKGLLAYRADSGEPAWAAATGPNSYTSPQPVTISGQTQVLFLSDRGLVSIDPATGNLRWSYEAPRDNIWRAVQPRSIGEAGVLFGSEDLGLVRLDLADGDAPAPWSATERWASKAMKPAYNDFVTAEGCVYGFDAGIFCCVDAETGQRRWKAGRYGHGQVLLLSEQQLLLVLSETGDVALVAAKPDAYREIARFPAIAGKSWSHPVVAHGRLYVRNDETMACYELPVAGAK
jgi:outer membrane protein assembly factor BamB